MLENRISSFLQKKDSIITRKVEKLIFNQSFFHVVREIILVSYSGTFVLSLGAQSDVY